MLSKFKPTQENMQLVTLACIALLLFLVNWLVFIVSQGTVVIIAPKGETIEGEFSRVDAEKELRDTEPARED